MSDRFTDEYEDLFGDDLPGDDADDSGDAVQGSGQVAARLPGGSGYLIVDGPGAGSVTSSSAGSDIREAPALPGRDQALDGTLPMLIIHRAPHHWRALPRLLAQLHAAAGAHLTLGVASSLPMAAEQSHADFSSACTAAAVRLVDPLGYLADRQDLRVDEPSERAKRWAPYLDGVPVTAGDLLNMQRDRGANLLLTSGRALDPSDPEPSLDAACAEGDDALALLKPGERLALNLTMSAAWLTRPVLLNALLAQLVDQEQFDTWHVRVQWPGSVRAYAQATAAALLAGYRQLAEVAADEERRLLLPQTGLTGWLMLAYGAAGFGTGLSGSYQAFTEPAGGGGGKPRIERYFERQLLHTVERTARPLLTSDPAYVPCPCPYCPPLFAAAAWSHQYAGLHYLFNVGTLAAGVAPAAAGRRGTHGAVGRAVRSARVRRRQGPYREQRSGAPACLGSAPVEGARSRPNTRPTGPDTAPEKCRSASRSASSSRRARSMSPPEGRSRSRSVPSGSSPARPTPAARNHSACPAAGPVKAASRTSQAPAAWRAAWPRPRRQSRSLASTVTSVQAGDRYGPAAAHRPGAVITARPRAASPGSTRDWT
jgi:hypothetical protein